MVAIVEKVCGAALEKRCTPFGDYDGFIKP
jgi:hypothetical protein